jgi:glucose-1-phosphate adenylyltransferase
MRETLALLLAGGVGSRLNILVELRAKPAVPFGGIYRIIDFTLSNVMNSGISRVGILTQYKPLSLMTHVGTGEAWDLGGRMRQVKILPPRTGTADSDWYKGTADAIRQNLDYLTGRNPKRLLFLSGDHIYQMDYRAMMAYHLAKKAEITVAVMEVPLSDAVNFGCAILDAEARITGWEEKPQKPRGTMASMGIYIFNTPILLDLLGIPEGYDFGRDLIPRAIAAGKVFGYLFKGYWRDVGTLNAYFQANMDLLHEDSGLSPERWGVRTNLEEEGRKGDRPPAFVSGEGTVVSTLISHGCRIEGTVSDSILSPGVHIAKGAVVHKAILMHDVRIEANARVEESILDKEVRVGEGAKIGVGAWYGERLTLVGKQARIPPGQEIGKNCIIYPKTNREDFEGLSLPAGSTLKKGGGL